MKKFFLGAGSCPRRNVDIQRVHEYLKKNGWQEAEDERQADLLVVPTCAYSVRKERMSVNAVKRAYEKKRGDADLVITGCLTEINPGKVGKLRGVKAIAPKDLEELDRFLGAKVKITEVPEPNIMTERDVLLKDTFLGKFAFRFAFKKDLFTACACKIRSLFAKPRLFANEDAFFIKIADGCLGQCTYCAIKFATGPLRSKPKEMLLEEFDRGLEKGHERFVLLAEDCGAYGVDIGTDIVQLLQELLSRKGNYKVRINDINAQWLIRYYDRLVPVLKEHQDRIESVLIPVQSGSDRILNLMKRPYESDKAREKLVDLRQKIPGLPLKTHILIGFPGETEEDFRKTEELLDAVRFSEVQVFLYDDRPRTEASCMSGKVPRRLARKRGRAIMRRSKKKMVNFSDIAFYT